MATRLRAEDDGSSYTGRVHNPGASAEWVSANLANILDTIDYSIVVVGRDFTVAHFNSGAAALLGLTPSDIGHSPRDIHVLKTVIDLENLCAQVMADRSPFRREVRHGNGWFLLRIAPYTKSDGQIGGAVLTLTNVTAFRASLEQAIYEREYTKAILNTVIEPLLVLDADLRVRTANRAFYAMFQLSREETQNVPLYNLGNNEWNIPRLWTLLKEIISDNSEAQTLEVGHAISGIGRRTLLLNARRLSRQGNVGDLILLAFQDITERKQAEAAKAALAAIVESSDDAIVSKDLNGIITSWNRGAEQIFGYHDWEIIGKPIALLIPPGREDEEPVILARIRRGERIDSYETVRRRKDGGLFDVSLTVSPIKDPDGIIIGASKIARNISGRKRVEKELREYAEQLKDADRRKDEFLATLAHELRNPLAPIRNAVELFKQPNLTAENFQLARQITESQLNQMVRLIDDLMDLSRISQGKIELKKERVTLKSLIDQALETSRPHLEAAGHKLSVSLPPRRVYLDADPVRLAQVLLNLINNACKYSPNNSNIEVKAELETAIENKGSQGDAESGIGEAVAEPPMELRLSVKDTGIGIAPEHLPRIFEMFLQVGSALDRSEGGLGIGLSLVRGLVERHGGSVEARSEGLGKGSEFILRLPTAPALADESAMSSGDETVPSFPSRLKRILVIDDNKNQARSLALLLNAWGFDARSVYDARSALALLEEFTPQVALIDIGLPDINGYELARRLRGLTQLKGITLIAQTGWGRDTDREEARQAGFDHHLTKPIDHQVLQNLLRSE